MRLLEDRYYETDKSSTICCGKCWNEAIRKTSTGEYRGDEAVLIQDLTILPNDEPLQCDECLVQNEAYEEFGPE